MEAYPTKKTFLQESSLDKQTQGCHTRRPETNRWAGAHYARRKPGLLDIFSEYSLKIPQIYSNMLEYTRIYSNISLSGGCGGLPGERAGKRAVQAVRAGA
jgi:hypothetical protein